MKNPSILTVFLMLMFAIVSFTVEADAAEVYPGGAYVPDIPGFVGYADRKIVIKLDSSMRRALDNKQMPRGRSGIAALDHLGKQYGVQGIRPQFPKTRQKKYKGRIIDLSGWHKITFAKETDVLSAVEKYKAIPGVLDAQPVSIHTVYAIPYEQFYDYQWHLPKIHMPDAWDIETGNSDIIVAMLDTGVRYFTKDLGGADASYANPTAVSGNIWVNSAEKNGTQGVDDDGNGYIDDWVGYDFVESTTGPDYPPCFDFSWLIEGLKEDCDIADNDPRDFHGHGTHCAGIVAAMNNNAEGLASPAGGWGDGTLQASGNGVRIMSLRIGWSAIMDLYEVGLVEMDYAAEALCYAADNGARIASCSWGSENTGGIEAAIDYFLASGGLIFKAAGNSNSDIPDYVAARDDIITVAATDEDDCRAYFSNYGDWIDIAAPGVNIWSLYHDKFDPETDYAINMDGTSMAAPLAASVAALIWSQNPGLLAEQVKQRLLNSADPIDQLSCNSSYINKLGAGRVNAFNAFDTCKGNFDGDGDVDGSDLAVFAADFGRTDCDTDPPCQGDFDNDGDVDGSDLAIFAADFGRTDCP